MDEMEATELSRVRARTMLSKVPEVTVYFWIIKIMATTVGETAADFLNTNLKLGLTATVVMGGLLAAVLGVQFKARRYVPPLYWLAVVLISVVGTLITDNLVTNFGVSLWTTTGLFAIALGATFWAWYASERTLSIHSIYTTKREGFYWVAILFTFALGTAAATWSPNISTWATGSPRSCSTRSSRSWWRPGATPTWTRCSPSGWPTS